MRYRELGLSWVVAALALACGGATGASSAQDNEGTGGTDADRPVSMDGTGGTGGDLPLDRTERCPSVAPALRACDAGAPWAYFDGSTGECHAGGLSECSDQPSFASVDECIATCPGAKAALTTCSTWTDCAIVATGCCGGCEPVLREHLVSVNHLRVQGANGCQGDVLCGACEPVDEADSTRGYFTSECQVGSCAVMDVREAGYANCEKDEDCFLRNGTDYCEGCDDSGYVALSSIAFLSVPPDTVLACPGCVSVPPEGLEAYCDLEAQRCDKRMAAAP